jgi:hypothetical protein
MMRIAVLVTMALLGSISTASASLIGDPVNLELHYDLDNLGPGGTNFNGGAVVGGGIEFSIAIFSDINTVNASEGTLNVDLSGNTLTLSQVGSQYPDILLFDLFLTGLNSTLGNIVGVTPVVIGNAFNLSFTGTSVTIQNLQNYNPPSNFTNVYQLEFERSAVPEPATLLLVGAGLITAGVRRRIRNTRTSR